MLNHFRTLLLNLPYAAPEEHIPRAFNGIELPVGAGEIYTTLFPSSTTREFRSFLAHNYIKLIYAAGLEAELKRYDSRISYPVERDDFFKIYRHSNPVVSNFENQILIYGQYSGNIVNNSFHDDFRISQVGSTSNILIYSTVQSRYINGSNRYDTVDPAAQIALTFNAGVSDIVNVGTTGVSFKIVSADPFTNTGNKTWQFVIEAPFVFNFNSIFSDLKSLSLHKFFQLKSDDITKYENLWNDHYNPVYQMAGLLLAYISKLNVIL